MDVEVEFTYYRPDALEVFLLGDFNGWDSTSLPMQRTSDGLWVCRVALPGGSYLYRYLVHPIGNGEDDAWFSDSDESFFRADWSPIGANAVVVVDDDGKVGCPTHGPADGNGRKTQPVGLAQMTATETLRINEQEQDLLRCFRQLPDDHVRSDILHFIRDFVQFGPPER